MLSIKPSFKVKVPKFNFQNQSIFDLYEGFFVATNQLGFLAILQRMQRQNKKIISRINLCSDLYKLYLVALIRWLLQISRITISKIFLSIEKSLKKIGGEMK